MFYFDKKIYYIDYYENGNRLSNAGFISLTFKDDDCHVHVGIRNLPGAENRVCRWFGLINSEQVFLEEFRVEKGEADFINCYKRNSLGRTEVDFSALEGFYFALGKRRWGSCFFRNIKQHMEPAFQEKPIKQPIRDNTYQYTADSNTENELHSIGLNEDTENGLGSDESGIPAESESDVDEWNGNAESELSGAELKGYVKKESDSEEFHEGREADLYDREWRDGVEKDTFHEGADEVRGGIPGGRGNSEKDAYVQEPVHRTTWEELTETHQLVHPFEDQGDYISINPFTLKLLAPEYRKLANNSFLLHGFYNYRHLILGYYQDEEHQGYYIGVPGTFDEREQMVAEMFGFEGYEPAGGVGYYMRKVEF